MAHSICLATTIKTKCWPLPTVNCQCWGSLAAFVCPCHFAALQANSSAVRDLVFFGPPCLFSGCTRVSKTSCCGLARRVLLVCAMRAAQRSACETLWNYFSCKATRINLIWGREAEVCVAALLYNVSAWFDGTCALKGGSVCGLLLMQKVSGDSKPSQWEFRRSKQLQSRKACGLSVVVSASDWWGPLTVRECVLGSASVGDLNVCVCVCLNSWKWGSVQGSLVMNEMS